MQNLFKESVNRFIDYMIEPDYNAWEKAGETPPHLWPELGQAGVLCPHIPEEYGGPGLDLSYNFIVQKELAKRLYTSTALSIAVHSDIISTYILKYATEEAKQKYLPKMVSGECIGAIGMTEPDAGSDLRSIKTRAIEKENHWEITGQKTFISNGLRAGLLMCAAKTETDIGLFLVPLANVDRHKLEKRGLMCQDTATIFLDKVKIPKENVLGEYNCGFAYMHNELALERFVLCLSGIYVAKGILRQTIDFVKQRTVFGQALSKFQNTKFKLAECKSKLLAAEAFLEKWENDIENLTPEIAASLKVFCTDVQNEVVDECYQLYGGSAFMLDYPIGRIYAEARIQKIYGGSNEIMKTIIAKEILK